MRQRSGRRMIVVNVNMDRSDSMVVIDVDCNQVRVTKWDRTTASDTMVVVDVDCDGVFIGDRVVSLL